MSVEANILKNRFIDRPRTELVVDRVEYDILISLLQQLAVEWRGREVISKAVAQDLYVLAPITKNMADTLREHAPKLADEVDDLAIEIDGLVLECFADT